MAACRRRDTPMRMVVYLGFPPAFGGCGGRIISRMDLGRIRPTDDGGVASASDRGCSALRCSLERKARNLKSSGKTNSGALFSTSGKGASGLLFDTIGRKRRGLLVVAFSFAVTVVARVNFSGRGRDKKSFDMRNDIISGFLDVKNTPAERGSNAIRKNKNRERPARYSKAVSPLRTSSLQSM